MFTRVSHSNASCHAALSYNTLYSTLVFTAACFHISAVLVTAAACSRQHLATKCDLWPSPAHDSYTWLFLLKAERW